MSFEQMNYGRWYR